MSQRLPSSPAGARITPCGLSVFTFHVMAGASGLQLLRTPVSPSQPDTDHLNQHLGDIVSKATFTHIHTVTDGGVNHAGRQPAGQNYH